MPLNIAIEQKKWPIMLAHLLGFGKIFFRPIVLSVSALVLAWFQDTLLLQVESIGNIDFVMPAAKVVSSTLALVLTGLSGWYAHSKYMSTRHKERMEKIDWLTNRGVLKNDSTPVEIKKALNDFF